MDLSSPMSSVVPSAHGPVLSVLVRTHAPLTGRRVAELTNPPTSQRQVSTVLTADVGALEDARAHLAKAQEFLAAAELTLDLDLFNAATSSAVSSGINSKDAICLRQTGVSRKADNHAQAVAELAQAGDAGTALTQTFCRLLRMKPAAQYQAYPDRACGNVDVEGLQAGRVAGEEIGLGQRRTVDRELLVGVAADDVVSGQSDDSLDEVVALVVGQQPDKGQRRVQGVAQGGAPGGNVAAKCAGLATFLVVTRMGVIGLAGSCR